VCVVCLCVLSLSRSLSLSPSLSQRCPDESVCVCCVCVVLVIKKLCSVVCVVCVVSLSLSVSRSLSLSLKRAQYQTAKNLTQIKCEAKKDLTDTTQTDTVLTLQTQHKPTDFFFKKILDIVSVLVSDSFVIQNFKKTQFKKPHQNILLRHNDVCVCVCV
jgi:MFS superfamily sulfate permease-like transporter